MATSRWQIQRGSDVVGLDGGKVGEVSDLGPNYILITKGFFFPKDIYIPFDAISDVRNDVVQLSMSKDQVDQMNWDQPPRETSAGMGTTTGQHEHGHTHTDTHTDTTMRDRPRSTGSSRQEMQSGTSMRGEMREGETRIPVSEEELVARKTAEQTGEVEVQKRVVEQEKSFQVPVSREEVHVERRDTDRPLQPGEQAFQEGTMRVPIVEEHVDVEKRAHVVGEVVVSKETTQQQQQVSGTVRREEVHVDKEGAHLGEDWEHHRDRYRNDWQQRYGAQGGRWEDAEPHYRFAHESAYDRRYHGRDYHEVEPELRRDWETRGSNTPWETVSSRVREGWERARGRR
jgi:uncharacterized protein (TIGR02271 family)